MFYAFSCRFFVRISFPSFSLRSRTICLRAPLSLPVNRMRGSIHGNIVWAVEVPSPGLSSPFHVGGLLWIFGGDPGIPGTLARTPPSSTLASCRPPCRPPPRRWRTPALAQRLPACPNSHAVPACPRAVSQHPLAPAVVARPTARRFGGRHLGAMSWS
jgi:hypothetical protein